MFGFCLDEKKDSKQSEKEEVEQKKESVEDGEKQQKEQVLVLTILLKAFCSNLQMNTAHRQANAITFESNTLCQYFVCLLSPP